MLRSAGLGARDLDDGGGVSNFRKDARAERRRRGGGTVMVVAMLDIGVGNTVEGGDVEDHMGGEGAG